MSSSAPGNRAAPPVNAETPARGYGDPLMPLKTELAAKDRKIISLEAALAQRETEIRTLESTLAAVYASTTWKLGAPLRLANQLLVRMANRTHGREFTPDQPSAAPDGHRPDEPAPASYSEWQRLRLAERLRAVHVAPDSWNHLFTVVIFADAPDGASAFPATLASLHRQTYRNIEVLIAGAADDLPPGLVDFSAHRGLFLEPALHPLDVLASPAVDRLWRGSHLTFARAGTEFAPDAFALFNAALSPADGAPAPDLIICDHDRLDGSGEVTAPSLAPGWDPDFICAFDYVETAFVASRMLIEAQRGQQPASLHDWLCGVARRAHQPVTSHLAEPLVHLPVSAPPPILKPAMPAVASPAPGNEMPSLAIVIPNRNNPELLKRCLRFLEFANRFRPELVIVDNASDEAAVHAIYRDLRERYGARIVQMDQTFNFSRMVNLGVGATTADVVLLLNNDVEITTPGSLEQIMAHAQRPEVGVVGCRLLYANGTVQHAGMLLRPGQTPEHPVRSEHVLRHAPGTADGYLHQLRTIRNYQCVTGAVQAMRRKVFDTVGGFDEVNLPVEYGDVDFCLRVRTAGWRVIALPLDGIVHRESSTRGTANPPAVIAMRTAAMKVIAQRWPDAVARDPYRNPWVEVGEVPGARFPWSPAAAP
jgi:O-antigen biosynthesis protein